MTQRKLSRQLTLWEGPVPPQAPAPSASAASLTSLTSPQSPLDATRGHSGCTLFRRLKLNRSIQERRRSYHDSGSYRLATKLRLPVCGGGVFVWPPGRSSFT